MVAIKSIIAGTLTGVLFFILKSSLYPDFIDIPMAFAVGVSTLGVWWEIFKGDKK